MPLSKRSVSPQAVSVDRLPPGIKKDELQCISNGSLANLIRQLSSLSQAAETTFSDLFHDMLSLEHRTQVLLSRVTNLRVAADEADREAADELPSSSLPASTALARKPAHLTIDQAGLNRSTLPTALAGVYKKCDDAPELDRLTPYREDGKPGLKFYSDPDFFFELWRHEMLKDDKLASHAKKVSKPSERIQQQPAIHSITTTLQQQQPVQSQRVPQQEDLPEYYSTEFIRGQIRNKHQQQSTPVGMAYPYNSRPDTLEGVQPPRQNQPHRPAPVPHQANMNQTAAWVLAQAAEQPQQMQEAQIKSPKSPSHMTPGSKEGSPSRRPGKAPPAPPPTNGMERSVSPDLPPPPPPLNYYAALQETVVTTPGTPQMMNGCAKQSGDLASTAHFTPTNGNGPPPMQAQVSAGAPPPPPPPPPLQQQGEPIMVKRTPNGSAQRPPVAAMSDARSDLLESIRKGINLRRVEARREAQSTAQAAHSGHDVAAILMQRMAATRMSDTDEESDTEHKWSDESD